METMKLEQLIQATSGLSNRKETPVLVNGQPITEIWCCTIKVDIENSKSQYIEKDKQEATKDGSESTKI